VLRLLTGRSFAKEAQDDKNKGCHAEPGEIFVAAKKKL
jgi:hypothetical protein